MSAHRDAVITGVNEAMQAGARQSAACEIIGISAKTLQRWEQPDNTQDGRLDAVVSHAGLQITGIGRRRWFTGEHSGAVR